MNKINCWFDIICKSKDHFSVAVTIRLFCPQGQPEFLGRAIIKPKVKSVNDIYVPPEWPARLEWHDVYRGPSNAGEILASFELLQVLNTAYGCVRGLVRCVCVFVCVCVCMCVFCVCG